jgi:diguanylate cyclase (GGDEF)-like protein
LTPSLRTEIANADKRGDQLIVLLLDLDNFKGINDRFGHAAGDLVLKEFARRLSKGVRASDTAVRLGGDEFLVILPECPPEKMDVVLSRLTDFVVEMGQDRIPVSSSRGWAQYEELMTRADEALYAHKAMRAEHAVQH